MRAEVDLHIHAHIEEHTDTPKHSSSNRIALHGTGKSFFGDGSGPVLSRLLLARGHGGRPGAGSRVGSRAGFPFQARVSVWGNPAFKPANARLRRVAPERGRGRGGARGARSRHPRRHVRRPLEQCDGVIRRELMSAGRESRTERPPMDCSSPPTPFREGEEGCSNPAASLEQTLGNQKGER